MEFIRTIPASNVRVLNEMIQERHPMFPGFMQSMIRNGAYVVIDENGTRLPTEKALDILE